MHRTLSYVRVVAFFAAALLLYAVSPVPGAYAITAELLTASATSSWTTSHAPFNTYYMDSRAQSIYLKSDLEAIGMAGPTTITEACLYASANSGRDLANLRIRMQNSILTTLSAFTTTGWTTVYGPTTITKPTANQWVCRTLSPAFVWDGASNLMVDVYRNDTAYTSGGGNYTRTTAAGRTYSGYCDNCSGCGVGQDCDTPTTRAVQSRVLSLKLTFDSGGVNLNVPSIAGPVSGITETSYAFEFFVDKAFTGLTKQGAVVDIEKLAGATDVAVAGNYAYVVSREDDSFSVFDISVPANPTFVASITDTSTTILRSPTSVFVAGNYAYVTSATDNGLEIINISVPTTPVHAGSILNGSGGASLLYPTDVFVVGNYAYVASNFGDALEIVNVSNPVAPVHAGKLTDDATTALNGARAVYVSGNYAYVVSDTDDGLEIVNVSNPASPTHVSALFDDATAYLEGADTVVVSGGYAYIGAAGLYDSGLEVVNVSDPANPTHVIAIEGDLTRLSMPYDMKISGTNLYVSSAAGDTFDILDISNPANPVYTGGLKDNTTTVFDRPGCLFISGSYAYVTGRTDHGFSIIDITVSTAPVHTGSISDMVTTGLGGAQSVAISGSYAYVVSHEDGAFSVVDVSSTTNPVLVGTLFDSSATLLAGAQDVAVSGDYAYIVSYDDQRLGGDNGLEIIDISNPANPIHVGSLPDTATTALSYPTKIVVVGDYAYVASHYDHGLEIVDISNPASPTHVSKIIDDASTALYYPNGLFISGDHAYVTSNLSDGGLEIIDISDPANPTHAGALFDDTGTILGNANDVYVAGGYAYVVSGYLLEHGFQVVDVSDPANPIPIGSLADSATTALLSPQSVTVLGSYAYIASESENGIEVVDISDPAAPVHAGKIVDDDTVSLRGAYDVTIAGDSLFVAAYDDDSLQIFEIPNDAILYGVDWDKDDVVDAWSATTTTNRRFSASHSWSSVGDNTFQALTKDAAGVLSAWEEHTISLMSSDSPEISSCVDNVNTATTPGTTASFSCTWADPDLGETVRVLISRDPDFDMCDYNDQTGCLAASGQTSASPASASYLTLPTDADIKWYARACDDDGHCSSAIEGGVFMVSLTSCQYHNVYGFAWAGELGWASFSCEDTSAPHDHGVSLDKATGVLSGFAWSDDGGRISFNPGQDGIPSENGLIGGWSLNEGGGTSVGDASHNSNDGLITGATWAVGKYGDALSFDGSSYVTIPSSASLDNVSDQVTLEAWINPTTPSDTSDLHTIVGKEASGASAPTYSCGGYNLLADTDQGGLYFQVQNRWESGGVVNCKYLMTSYTLPAVDQWYHVVGMYDATTSSIKLYVNGALVNSTPFYSDAAVLGKSIGSNTKPLTIGGDPADSGSGPLEFEGLIDEVRVYNRILSAREIGAHYQSRGVLDAGSKKIMGYARACVKENLDGGYECGRSSAVEAVLDTSGLVLGFLMDEDAGTSVTDSSTSTNDGSFTTGVSWALGRFNTGLYFDGGASSYVTVPDDPSLNITGAITMEAWVKPDIVAAGGDFHTILNKSQGGAIATEAGYAMYTNEDQTGSCFEVKYTSGYVSNCGSGLPELVPNAWNHLVGIYNSATGDARYYVNGTLIVSGTIPSSIGVTSNPLHIGGNPAADDQVDMGPYKGIAEFKGAIDEVRIYNRALTESEVVAHFRGFAEDHSSVWNGWISLDGTTLSYGPYNMMLNTTPTPHEFEGFAWMGEGTPTGHKENEAGDWMVFDCSSCAADATCLASYPTCASGVHPNYKVLTDVSFNGPDAPVDIRTDGQTNPIRVTNQNPTLSAEYENSNVVATGNHWDKADEWLDATQCIWPDNTYNMCYDLSTHVYTYSMTEQADVYAFQNTTPLTYTINSVEVRVRYHGGARGPIVRLNGVETVGGSSGSNTGCYYNDHYEPCGFLTGTFATRPGGGSWTWDDINNLQAGAFMRSTDGAIATSTMGWLEQIYVVVTYNSTSKLVLVPNGAGDYANIDFQEPAGAAGTEVASSYRVQVIQDGGDWSTPLWDSGETVCSVEKDARMEVVYGGSPITIDGSKYYQRWKFWDSYGKEGPWSSGTSNWTTDPSQSLPEAPTITGPTMGSTSTIYTFGFVATSGDEQIANTDGTYLINMYSMSPGFSHTCALSGSGDSYCWGDPQAGRLGDDQTATDRLTPVRVHDGAALPADTDGTYLTNMKSITTGNYHTCTLSNGGSPYCWGGLFYGQTGDDQTTSRLTPVRVHDGAALPADTDGTYLTNIKQLVAGGYYNCALSNSGAVYCWGWASDGQLGDDQTATNRLTPVRVHDGAALPADTDGTYLTNIKSITAGLSHTCALSNSGTAYCWGDGFYGQLGDNQAGTDRLTPVRVHDGAALPADTDGTYLINVKSISAGSGHTCALSNSEAMYCWGDAAYGQLGDGQIAADRLTPVRVHDGAALPADTDGTYLTNISSIDMGTFHTCVLSNGGTPYCWGRAAYGKLGDDQIAADRLTPVRVHDGAALPADTDGTYLTHIKQITAGAYHTCALSIGEAAYCWGEALDGKLGDDQSTTNRLTPVRVHDGAAFGVVSANNIRYGIDWDMDGGGLTAIDSDYQGGGTRNVTGDGSFIYAANGLVGVSVYSVDASGNLTHVDSDNPDPGHWVSNVWHDGRFLYVTVGGQGVGIVGLHTYSVSSFGYLTLIDSVDPGNSFSGASGVWSDGQFIYLANGVTGIVSLSVDENGYLTEIDSDYQAGVSWDIWGDGEFLYVANSNEGIYTYSVDASGFLTYIDSDDQGDSAMSVWGDGRFVYVSNNGGGLHSYSVDASGYLAHIDFDDQGGQAYDAWGDGRFIYLANAGGGLHSYIVDDAGYLTHIDFDDQGQDALGVWTDGQFVYLAYNDGGLYTYAVDLGIDEWVPSIGYVVSGTQASTTRSWNTPGVKMFQALTEDENGAYSGWTRHEITIGSADVPTGTITSPTDQDQTSPVTLRGMFVDPLGHTFQAFQWYLGACETGTLIQSGSGGNAPSGSETSDILQVFADGSYDLFFRVQNSVGIWSACDSQNINVAAQCADGIDNGDADLWDDANDPACYNFLDVLFDPENPGAWFDDTIASEANNPQCSDGTDNDGDGKIDDADGGCHDDFDPSNGASYNKFRIRENTCNVITDAVIMCDPDESFGLCPVDCADQFRFIEF